MVRCLSEVAGSMDLSSNTTDVQVIEEIILLLQSKGISIGRAAAILDDTKEVLQRVVIV